MKTPGYPQTASNLFVSTFDASGNLVASTYVGGSVGESLGALRLDSSGDPWVSGQTFSTDFPLSPESLNLGSNFLVHLAADGTHLVQSETVPNGVAGGAFSFVGGNQIVELGDSSLLFLPLALPATPTIVGIVSATGQAVTDQVAPGELISVYGANLGPVMGVAGSFDSSGKLATTIGGTQVLVNGTPIPLLYASATQINAVIPFEIGVGTTDLQVSNAGLSETVPLTNVVSDPGVFGSGTTDGYLSAIVVNQDGTLNSASNPADRG